MSDSKTTSVPIETVLDDANTPSKPWWWHSKKPEQIRMVDDSDLYILEKDKERKYPVRRQKRILRKYVDFDNEELSDIQFFHDGMGMPLLKRRWKINGTVNEYNSTGVHRLTSVFLVDDISFEIDIKLLMITVRQSDDTSKVTVRARSPEGRRATLIRDKECHGYPDELLPDEVTLTLE